MNEQLAIAPLFSCAFCQSAAVRTEIIAISFQYGVGSDAVTLERKVPLRICEECGAEYFDHVAEEVKHDAVCQYLGLLCPREIRSIRESYGTQADFASLTGISPASLSRWETGASIQSRPYDNFLRLLRRQSNIAYLTGEKKAPRPTQSATTSKFRCIEITPAKRQQASGFELRRTG